MKKNKFLILLLFCLAIFSFARPTLAITVPEIPNPRQIYGGWVSDTANLLTPQTEAKLNQKISNLQKDNSSEIAIVTVLETGISTPKQFATELFNYWKIGNKERNNGVLFLISRDDRRVEIETGYGVEKILSNEQVSKIIERQIIPYFKVGNFDEGTLVGTEKIILALKEFQVTNERDLSTVNERDTVTVIIILTSILLAILGFIVIAIRDYLRPEFVELGGRSRRYNSSLSYSLNCANCQQPMKKLNSQLIMSNLSLAERTAQEIGSVEFEIWQCDRCNSNQELKNFHIRARIIDNNRFIICPNCQEFTVKKDAKTIETPTKNKSGKMLITKQCQCCNYSKEITRIIPPISNSGNYSDSSSGGYYGGSSSSGGSFGGGGSDGGGAGGSF